MKYYLQKGGHFNRTSMQSMIAQWTVNVAKLLCSRKAKCILYEIYQEEMQLLTFIKWILSNEKDIYLRLDIVNYNGKYCELDSDCNVDSFIAWLPVR